MRLLVLCAAFLSGAAGLALEANLIGASGACLGHSSAAALGLAAFLAAWALGAWTAARVGRPSRGRLLAVGAALLATGVLGTWGVLRAGGAGLEYALAALVAFSAIGAVGFLQGLLLPWIAMGEERRARPGDLAPMFGANLLGAAFGAHFVAGEVLGLHGRLVAAAVAGGLGLLSTLAAIPLVRAASVNAPREPEERHTGAAVLEFRAASVIVGAACAWTIVNEWIALRLCALWLGGMEPALRAGLVAALAALALGAAVLPRILPRGKSGVLAVILLAALSSCWFAFLGDLAPASSTPRDAVDALGLALVIAGPPLVALGALVPLAHRALARPDAPALGRLLLHEAWGAAAGVALAHWVLVPAGGLALAAAFGVGCGAVAALSAARGAPVFAGSVLLACGLAGTFLATRPPLSEAAPAYRDPSLVVRSLREDREFAVAVVDDGVRGERTLFTDAFRAAGTGREYRYMQVLGHLPILLHPAPRNVAVLALGTGTTLGAVSEHAAVEHIDVLEIAPAVVEAAPWFESKNHGVLAGESERVRVLLGDGRRTLADRPGEYDVITMEPLLPDSPFGVYLYTREFYTQARRALRPGGLLCQWVPPHALEPATFTTVLATLGAAFEWSGIWLAGTQVVLVGAAAEPALDGARFAVDGAAGASLAALGLDTPARVAARYVGSARVAPGAIGVLTDEHPWIVHRPRRAGPVLLGDLPDNLAALRGMRAELPAAWERSSGPTVGALREAVLELHRARELHASEEARQRGLARADQSAVLRAALELARRELRDDPEFVELEEELEFLSVIRRGVQELAGGEAGRAQLALERAAELRPERADVALYLAVARERSGDPDAAASIERAAALCPGVAGTPEGARARALGLSDAAWSRLTALVERGRSR